MLTRASRLKVGSHAATKEPKANVMIAKSILVLRGNDLSPARGRFKSDRTVEREDGDGRAPENARGMTNRVRSLARAEHEMKENHITHLEGWMAWNISERQQGKRP
jgi:hypothetical protein